MKKGHQQPYRRLLAALLFIVLGARTALAQVPYPGAVPEGGLHGWLQNGGYYWYYDENGQQIVDGFSPDGYYLDRDGRWRYEVIELLGQQYKTPDRYAAPSDYGDFSKAFRGDTERLWNSLQRSVGTSRLLKVSPDAITYMSRNQNNQGKVLLGLYREERTNSWRFRVATYLGDRSGNTSLMSTYDDTVFRYLLSRVSHVPAYAADAVYQSWQGTNAYGIAMDTPIRIGDVTITLKVVNGAADYYITRGN